MEGPLEARPRHSHALPGRVGAGARRVVCSRKVRRLYRRSQYTLEITFQQGEVVSSTAVVSILWTQPFNEMRWPHLPP